PRLADAARAVEAALTRADIWLAGAAKDDPGDPRMKLEAGARRFAMTLGRIMELALLIKHAQWAQQNGNDGRASAAARRFASAGVDLLAAADTDDVRILFE